MKDAYRGGKAYVDKMKMSENPLASDFWQPERRPDKGVTLNTPDAYPGYTLYTSGHSSAASPISLDGKVLHRWQLPFSAVWYETSPLKEPVPATLFSCPQATRLPDARLPAPLVFPRDHPRAHRNGE